MRTFKTSEKVRARAREYHWRNRDACLTRMRNRLDENRAEINARRRAKYAANPGPRIAASADYYELNQVKVIAARRRDAEKNRARGRLWYKKNPDKNVHKAATYRSRKAGAPGSHTLAQWLDKLSLFANLCAYCGEKRKLARDHKVPLSRGGSDDISNIVPACGSCNSSKRAKTAKEFIAWRLSVEARIA